MLCTELETHNQPEHMRHDGVLGYHLQLLTSKFAEAILYFTLAPNACDLMIWRYEERSVTRELAQRWIN